ALPNPTCGGQWCTMDNEPGWLTELASLGKQAAQVAERAAKTGQGVLIVQAAGNDSDLFCSPPNLPSSPCTSPSQPQEIRARNRVEFAWAEANGSPGPLGAIPTNILIAEALGGAIRQPYAAQLYRALSSDREGYISAPASGIVSPLASGYG